MNYERRAHQCGEKYEENSDWEKLHENLAKEDQYCPDWKIE